MHENDHHPGSFLGRKTKLFREDARNRRPLVAITAFGRTQSGRTLGYKVADVEAASGDNNVTYRHDIDTEGVRRDYAVVKDLSAVAKIFGCSTSGA